MGAISYRASRVHGPSLPFLSVDTKKKRTRVGTVYGCLKGEPGDAGRILSGMANIFFSHRLVWMPRFWVLDIMLKERPKPGNMKYYRYCTIYFGKRP